MITHTTPERQTFIDQNHGVADRGGGTNCPQCTHRPKQWRGIDRPVALPEAFA